MERVHGEKACAEVSPLTDAQATTTDVQAILDSAAEAGNRVRNDDRALLGSTAAVADRRAPARNNIGLASSVMTEDRYIDLIS